MPRQTSQKGPPPASVRERLLEAAKEFFATEGYENVSTATIARQAATSESQLIKHFGSKEGLLEAIFDEGWESLDQRLRQSARGLSSPLDKFLAIGGVFISAMGKDKKLRSLMLLQGRRIRKRGREVALSVGFRHLLRDLDGVLKEMQAAGHLRPDVHLEAARSALMGALEGLLRDQLLAELINYPARYSKRDLLQTFTMLLGSILEPAALRAFQQAQGEAQAIRS